MRIFKARLLRDTKTKLKVVVILLIVLWMLNLSFITRFLPSNSQNPLNLKVFIAANFYQNEEILPNFCSELVKLINYLGKENVFVSIYENGSDDRTKIILRELDSELGRMEVPRLIVTSPDPKKGSRRIPYLAKLRNVILQPLFESKDVTYDKIIFFNDVIWKLDDILTLLFTNDLDYDVACAMDFYYQFYDTFATRDLSGNLLTSGYPPYAGKPEIQKAVRQNKPFQVLSCWNGIAIYNPEPFLKGVRFRALRPEINGFPIEASECCIINTDLRQLGFTKIFINPAVKVAYHLRFYIFHNYIMPLIEPFFHWLNYPPIQVPKKIMGKASDLAKTKEEEFCVQ